jgi:hypothetical protein
VRIVFLFVLLLALPAGVRAEEDPPRPPPGPVEESPEAQRAFTLRVNEAITHGYEWLRAQQLQDGTFPLAGRVEESQHLGRHALVLFTLARCGATPRDRVIKRGLAGLDLWFKKVDLPGWGLRTYSAAMLILMYDALYAEEKDASGRGNRGTCRYPRAIQPQIRRFLDWLVAHQAERVWRYPGGEGGSEDLSHTQLVLLALEVAGHCGLEVESSVFTKALDYVFEKQEKDGPPQVLWLENPAWTPGSEDRYGRFLAGPRFAARGWGYLPKSSATGSMTAAGIACLAIVKSRLGAQGALDDRTRATIDRSMLEGLAWLAQAFTVTENPGWGKPWHYYYLWSLERVGTLLGRKHIGKRDWYREGADLLLMQQRPQGDWPAAPESETSQYEDALLQTCFALLFLKRATAPSGDPLWPSVSPEVTPR